MESRKLVQMNLCAGQKQMQKQRMNMWTWGKGKLGWIGGVALPCLHHRMWNTPLLGAAPAQGAPRHALRGLRWAWSGGLEGGLQRERAYVYLHFLHTAVEQELPQHWEPITRQLNIILKKQPLFMKKLKTELPHESAIALCIHPEKTTTEKDTRTTMFTAALLTKARTWKQPRCPSKDEWLRRCGTYIQWNITRP